MGLIDFVIAGLCLNATCPVNENDYKMIADQKKSDYFKLVEELKHEHLIITTLRNEKLSGISNDNATLMGTGVAFDLLNILQQKFKFNYTIKLPENNIWGSDQTGVLGMLINNEANLSAAFLPIITEYAVQYSPSLDTGEWVVLMKRPKESATGSGLLAPFTLTVWILILLSLCVVGPVIYFIIWVQVKLCKNDHNKIIPLPACIWFVYGALLKQGTTLNPITDSSRLLFSTWWIFITILTAFYTANLTAFLTLSKFTLPINSPEDIGAKKSKWVTTKGNALEDTMKLKNDENLQITRRILGYPQNYIDSSDSKILEQFVKKSNLMFIREKPIVEHVMYDDYKKKAKAGVQESDRCTFVITKFSVVSFKRAFAYSNQFKYRRIFDNTIQYLIESGIIQYKLYEELPDTQICPLNLGNKERQLRNSDLLMTYMIVGGGFIVSTVIFILEQIVQRCCYNTNKKLGEEPKQVDQFNNNYSKFFESPFNSDFITPPPSYYTLFKTPFDSEKSNIKKKMINGREYWVYDKEGEKQIVPLRTPSALLFQFTN